MLLMESAVHRLLPGKETISEIAMEESNDNDEDDIKTVLHSANNDSLALEAIVFTTSHKNYHKPEMKMLESLRISSMLVLVSIRSIFEGMAIGLEKTEAGVWQLFLAVSLHSVAMLFCIGREMIDMNTKTCRIVMHMIGLSLVTPIGVIIGVIITQEQLLIMGVLQGLVGGSLLYITIFEVLEKDKMRKYGMLGLLGGFTVMLGFITMTVIEVGVGGYTHG